MSEEDQFIGQVDETPSENQDAWYSIKEAFNEKQEMLFERLVKLMSGIAENEIPPMRDVDKKRLSRASTKVDAMFKKITLNNITALNKVMYCGGIITSELLGVKKTKRISKRIIRCGRKD